MDDLQSTRHGRRGECHLKLGRQHVRNVLQDGLHEDFSICAWDPVKASLYASLSRDDDDTARREKIEKLAHVLNDVGLDSSELRAAK